MVDVYAKLIINKKRTFDSVPETLQDKVRARLFELGYDTNGDPLTQDANSMEE